MATYKYTVSYIARAVASSARAAAGSRRVWGLPALGLGWLLAAPVFGAEPAASAAPAGDAAAAEGTGDGLALEEIVVTATANRVSKMDSSVSVSTLDTAQLQQLQPTSAADVLRDIPGIRAEASGGEGNANVAVRGLPIASGGAKYVQFQEDGLPVLEYGDIAFATPDTFMRIDYNTDHVEVVRGGSASTFASNAPGGVFNFISKTGGDSLQGNVGISAGLDYDEQRYDFDYGGPIGSGWKFHVGGFYRTGEGVRSVGYDNAEDGGQIKANLTHDFDDDKGFIRFNFKELNDRTPVYLPVPVQVNGSSFTSIPNFSAQSGALQTPYLQQDLAVGANGNRILTNINDGYHSEVTAFGVEVRFNLANDWKIDDNFRYANISGDFVGPYPAGVGSAAGYAASIGGAGGTLSYATGPNKGQTITNPAALGGNGLAVDMGLFNVSLPDMGNVTNNLSLNKSINGANDTSTGISLGLYESRQNIVQDWHWNEYLQEAVGKNAQLLNVANAAGVAQTQGGVIGYGTVFGGCCVRYENAHYDTTAPYAALNWQGYGWNVDGSLRYDIQHASGSYAAGTAGPYAVIANAPLTVPEQHVYVVNTADASPIDYEQHYVSYSVGANYEFNRDLAVFARVSEGGRANADRLLFGGGVNPDGSASSQVAIDQVRQLEAGVKWRVQDFSLFATPFFARTAETNQDVTQQVEFQDRVYHAYGLELEGAWQSTYVHVNGGVTYTHSRIVADFITPGDEGTAPQRQANLVYQFTPSFVLNPYFVAGVNIIGTTDSFSGQVSGGGVRLMQPGYTTVNAFVNYNITERLKLGFNANNLFNTIGITEVDSYPNAAGVATARSIAGRSIKGSLVYSF
jgi:outer membrane receptor protein involved in Fe transport